MPSDAWGEAVHAIVVTKPGHRRRHREEIIAFCRARIAHYKAPKTCDVRAKNCRRAARGKSSRPICANRSGRTPRGESTDVSDALSLVAALVDGIGAHSRDDAPLRIRNLAPASGIYGEPVALGGEVLASGYELTFNTQIANNFTSDANGDTLAFFDGETTYLTYGFRQAVAERFEWGIELPWVIHDGGYSITRSNASTASSASRTTAGARRNSTRSTTSFRIRTRCMSIFRIEKDGFGDVRVSGGLSAAARLGTVVGGARAREAADRRRRQAHRIGRHGRAPRGSTTPTANCWRGFVCR